MLIRQLILSCLIANLAFAQLSETGWHDLNGELLAQHLGGRTRLAVGATEFRKLLQPILDVQILEDRRVIILELLEQFSQLEPILVELSRFEHAFIFKKPADERSIFESLMEGSLLAMVTAYGASMTSRYLRNDYGEGRWFAVGLKLLASLGGFYQSVTEIRDRFSKAKSRKDELEAHIEELAQALQSLEKLTALVRQSPILAAAFPGLVDFEDSQVVYPELGALVGRIKQGMPVYHPAACESIWAQVIAYQGAFKALYRSVGRLDAYMAIVRIWAERVRLGLPVTLATFKLDSDRPDFEFLSLHNLLIQDSVAEDFVLSGHAIFNGPSTCGKSAAMKSIALAHVLGQSILLVPAQKAHFSPIHRFETYFNVGDDIGQGKSSFKAQNDGMRRIESAAHELKTTERMLVLVDEPYRGVPQSIGEKLVVDFTKRLVLAPGVLLLMSTHYEKPCLLEGVSLFQPELLQKDGKFERTYKMLPGFAQWWFHNENGTADAFIDQIFAEN